MVRKISGQSVNAREYSPELKRWVDAFLDYSAIRNYSRVTIQQRRYHLLSLLAWFDERSIVLAEGRSCAGRQRKGHQQQGNSIQKENFSHG